MHRMGIFYKMKSHPRCGLKAHIFKYLCLRHIEDNKYKFGKTNLSHGHKIFHTHEIYFMLKIYYYVVRLADSH